MYLMGKYTISLNVAYLLFALNEEQQDVWLFLQFTFHMHRRVDKRKGKIDVISR